MSDHKEQEPESFLVALATGIFGMAAFFALFFVAVLLNAVTL